jgi:hypothetical protein
VAAVADGDGGADAEPAPAIVPMEKDWRPPGIEPR